MKRRMLDGGIWANEKFAELPCMARLLQVGLVTLADDQGRMKGHPAYLRSQLFPYDDVAVTDISDWLERIMANGTIVIYETGGKSYIQLVNWWEYQSLQYASPSEHPRPDGWQDRIRYNAKGNMTLTSNWHTVSGEPLADTCDQEGNPLPIVATLPPRNPGGRPPKNPPENPPGFPPENVNKEQIKINTIEGKAEAAAPAAVNDRAQLWAFWERNMPGTRTPVIVDAVNALLDDYSVAEVEEAITIACKQNKRTLRYVEDILSKGAFSTSPSTTAQATNNGLAAILDYSASKGMFSERNR